MTETLAIAQIVMLLLPKITVGVEAIIGWLRSVRTAAKQAGVWTAEMDASYRAALLASGLNPINQPDP